MSSENEPKPENLNEVNSSAMPGENLESQEQQANTQSVEPGFIEQENQSETHASSANAEITEEIPAPELPAPLPMGSENQAARRPGTARCGRRPAGR